MTRNEIEPLLNEKIKSENYNEMLNLLNNEIENNYIDN